MDSSSLNIRKAEEKDLSEIMEMIQELAAHLKMEVTVAKKDIIQGLFHNEKAPELLLAEAGSQIVGYILFYYSFSTFSAKKGIYVEDLYVKKAFRKQGYGKAMMQKICDIAKQKRCTRIEWRALKKNQKTIEIYKKIGAIPMDNWLTFKLDEKGIERLGSS